MMIEILADNVIKLFLCWTWIARKVGLHVRWIVLKNVI